MDTLIDFAKFQVETVLIEKTCTFDSIILNFNPVELKKVQKIIKGHIFQRPKGQKPLAFEFFFGL